MSNFLSDRHTLYVGWVLGIALSNGLDVVPVVDEAGNYTDRLQLLLDGGSPAVTITIVIPEPPEDWTL